MTELQLKAVRMAIRKGLKNGLSADGIMPWVTTYEEMLMDDDDQDEDPESGYINGDYGKADPPPLVVLSNELPKTPGRLLVSASISASSESTGKSLEDMFTEIQAFSKDHPTVSFVNPGYKKPVAYNIEPYKSENSRVCGLNFSVVGDRSNVASRTVYVEGSAFDLEKDVKDFVESQQQIYKARSSPVVAKVPRPTSFSEMMSNMESNGENAGMVF